MAELTSHAYLAFLAGILSVLSPCVLPLMPAYLSLVSGISVEEMQQGAGGSVLRSRVLKACLGFIAGFSTVFIVMGVGAVMVGHVVRTWRAEVFGIEFGAAQIAGALIILLGLHMTGITPIRALYRDTRFAINLKKRNVISAFLVGAGFSLGWSPCIGPILAGILGIAGSRDTVVEGVVLLTIYSAGLGIPFLIAGWSIEYFFQAFDRIKLHFRKLEIASGLILMGVGFLLATDQFTRLNSEFRFMNDVVTAAEKWLL